MNMENYYVATFYSTNYALKCEKTLERENLNIKLIPVPRQVSSNCGLAARFSPDSLPVFLDLCKEGTIEVEGVYSVRKEGKNLLFTQLELN